MFFEQGLDRAVLCQPVTTGLHRIHEARSGALVLEAQAFGGEQRPRHMQRRRQLRRAQMKLIVNLQVQRQAQKRITLGCDLVDQAQRFRVGADQDMQAVVECSVVDRDTARAAAQRGCGFKHRDRNTAAGEFHCRRHAGVAAADDGDCFSRHQ